MVATLFVHYAWKKVVWSSNMQFVVSLTCSHSLHITIPNALYFTCISTGYGVPIASFDTINLSWQVGLLQMLCCIDWHPFGLVRGDWNSLGIIYCKGLKQMQIWYSFIFSCWVSNFDIVCVCVYTSYVDTLICTIYS